MNKTVAIKKRSSNDCFAHFVVSSRNIKRNLLIFEQNSVDIRTAINKTAHITANEKKTEIHTKINKKMIMECNARK